MKGISRLTILFLICAMLACSLSPTPTPTPAPTLTPTPTSTPVPTATVMPTPILDLNAFCIPPPQYAFVAREIWKEYPGAQIHRESAMFFSVRFQAAGG